MSYLHFPHLHFNGIFWANVATINNNVKDFDIEKFMSHDALRVDHGGKGMWNPKGTNDFLFKDTYVTNVCYANGKCVSDKKKDILCGKKVMGKNSSLLLYRPIHSVILTVSNGDQLRLTPSPSVNPIKPGLFEICQTGGGGGGENPLIPCNSAIWRLNTIKFGSVTLHYKFCPTTWKVLMMWSVWHI